MTFSPDGAFPVVNIEKGHLEGEFEAEFEASQELPRVKSIKAGTKINVVPGKAFAVFEGLDDDVVRAAADEVEKETGVSFEIMGKDSLRSRGPCVHASGGKECHHSAAPSDHKASICSLQADRGDKGPLPALPPRRHRGTRPRRGYGR